MTRHHSTPRTDGNQAEVVAALQAYGASVQSLAGVGKGCPDLLVGFRGVTYLLEVKDENSDIESRDRRNMEDSVFTIPVIPWDAFRDYLWYGQHYE